MHVSRLLARTLTQLRDHLVDEVDLPESWSSAPERHRLVGVEVQSAHAESETLIYIAMSAKRLPDRNRDPGADPDAESIPDIADDQSPGQGDVPEPQRPSIPTEAPVASTGYGTTEREQVTGEPLEHRLAHEEPDRSEIDEPRTGSEPGESAGIYIETEPADSEDDYVEEDDASAPEP